MVEAKGKGHILKVGAMEIDLSTAALFLILAGVIIPTVNYSLRLHDPTPAELLIAICMALFSGVVFLWILNATSVLQFRSEWIAKSVWGAAIVSVLGTSVGVYRDAFSERKYPYEGLWHMYVELIDSQQLVVDHELLLHYSTSAETYWGFAQMRSAEPPNSKTYDWAQITDFQPKAGTLKARFLNHDGSELVLSFRVSSERQCRLFLSKDISTPKYPLRLVRPL